MDGSLDKSCFHVEARLAKSRSGGDYARGTEPTWGRQTSTVVSDPPPLKRSAPMCGFRAPEGEEAKRHAPEEIVSELRRVDVLVSQGSSVRSTSRSWTPTR